MLGLAIGTALGLGNPATIALAVLLAFVFGYSPRGQGHAAVHAHHGHGGAPAPQPPGSSRKPIRLGVASIVVTLVVATGSAIVVESRRSEGHADAAYGAGPPPVYPLRRGE